MSKKPTSKTEKYQSLVDVFLGTHSHKATVADEKKAAHGYGNTTKEAEREARKSWERKIKK